MSTNWIYLDFHPKNEGFSTGKTLKAAKDYQVKEIIVAGGVSANQGLREALTKRSDIPVLFPPMRYCTDNAAMIGAAAYYAYKRGDVAGLDLNAKAVDTLK